MNEKWTVGKQVRKNQMGKKSGCFCFLLHPWHPMFSPWNAFYFQDAKLPICSTAFIPMSFNTMQFTFHMSTFVWYWSLKPHCHPTSLLPPKALQFQTSLAPKPFIMQTISKHNHLGEAERGTKREKITYCLSSLNFSLCVFSVIQEDTLLRAMQLGHPKKVAGQTTVICAAH